MTELDDRIASYAGERRLSRSSVERWRALDERERGMLWQVAHELRLGENHLRDVLDWLEEIRVRDGRGAAEILGREEIRRVLTGGLSRSDKIKEVKERFRRLRYPRLSHLEERLEEAVGKMELGAGVEVRFPAFFEGGEVRVELRAASVHELAERLHRLLRGVEDGQWGRLFTLLDEC